MPTTIFSSRVGAAAPAIVRQRIVCVSASWVVPKELPPQMLYSGIAAADQTAMPVVPLPMNDSAALVAVVPSPVATGSTRSMLWPGSLKYRGLISVGMVMPAVSLQVSPNSGSVKAT